MHAQISEGHCDDTDNGFLPPGVYTCADEITVWYSHYGVEDFRYDTFPAWSVFIVITTEQRSPREAESKVFIDGVIRWVPSSELSEL